MERRALIALALSFAVFMAFMYYGEKTKPLMAPSAVSQKAPAPPAAPAQAPPAAAAPGTPPAPAPVKASSTRPAKDVVVDTPSYKAVFTELGGRLKSFQLKKYKDRLPYEPIYHFKLGPVGFEVERYLNPATNGLKPKDLVPRAAPMSCP